MARTGRPKTELTLTEEEREQLVRWSRRAKSSQALALRSRIVLACAKGANNRSVAAQLNCAAATVGKWRRRFVAEGLDGLVDEPRPGRPPSISVEQVEAVVVATLEETPKNATHWSRASMAKRSGLSRTTIGRIWKAFELKPHRVDGFKLSTDPLFVEKVYDVVGLYLDPPESAVVLCVDEKSQVQALARTGPVLPMMPGMPERRTHDYVRHGVTSLFAAFNIADGTVISSIHRRHRAIEFKKFLAKIDTEIPDGLDVHLVCDNYGTHKTAAINAWLARHPRASTCTSPQPAPAGSTRSSAGSASSPKSSSAAAATPPSKPSKPTSAPGPRDGTKTPNHSSGPNPPDRSSSQSDDF
jgi:transposase